MTSEPRPARRGLQAAGAERAIGRRPRPSLEGLRHGTWATLAQWRAGGVGLALVLVALAVYLLSNPFRTNLYNHFVWQADAFLHGRFAITWPVVSGFPSNYYFREVMPVPGQPGLGLIPYPPLPALLLLPLVAVFGLTTNAALVAAVLGAVNVGLAWRLASRLTTDERAALLAAVFYGFGTVAWYAAMLGSTWFLAHVVASTFLFLAIGLALDGERQAAMERTGSTSGDGKRAELAAAQRLLDPRQVVAGLLLGMSALARLPTVFGAPFLVFVGSGGTATRRGLSAGIGAVIPVLLLVAYNLASTGQPFHPAYEYAYRTEYVPRAGLVHPEWAAEDPRYIPQNAVIMLAWPPLLRPECGLALLDPRCPLLQPDSLGMSLLLTSPGYLLVAGLVRRRRRTGTAARAGAAGIPEDESWEWRLTLGAALAVVAIALVNLAHFSQGWVQFGYRFSNDFAPFALVLVTLGIARLGVGWMSLALVAASIIVNAWGVYWGVVLRW